MAGEIARKARVLLLLPLVEEKHQIEVPEEHEEQDVALIGMWESALEMCGGGVPIGHLIVLLSERTGVLSKRVAAAVLDEAICQRTTTDPWWECTSNAPLALAGQKSPTGQSRYLRAMFSCTAALHPEPEYERECLQRILQCALSALGGETDNSAENKRTTERFGLKMLGDIRKLHKDLDREQFRLMLFGKHSCGKSTLLQALFPGLVLPTEITEASAYPVHIKLSQADTSIGHELHFKVIESCKRGELVGSLHAAIERMSSHEARAVVYRQLAEHIGHPNCKNCAEQPKEYFKPEALQNLTQNMFKILAQVSKKDRSSMRHCRL
jgi:hypothetical protein